MCRSCRPLLALLLLLVVWLTGCDAPLAQDQLIFRLGTNSYASFQITFFRFNPREVQSFLASTDPGRYTYEALIDEGPIERLQFIYTPRNHRVIVLRTGNERDAENNLIAKTQTGGRGPVEQVIRALKADPQRTAAWFARDLYLSTQPSDPEYFLSFDRVLRQRLEQQRGAVTDWQYVEFALTFALPDTARPVLTAEAALLPLTSTGPDGPVVSALLGLADREYPKLRDPLIES